jgi:hypothetical protein
MVHLTENAPLARSFASQLADAERRLASAWTVEAPEAGFAEWAGAASATPLDLPDFNDVIGSLSSQRWMEAPVLAAFGFRLAETAEVGWADRWGEGMRRLIARDPAPSDRNSFLFRRVELLGLAVGVTAADGRDPAPRRWLREMMETHAARLPTASMWSQLLLALARNNLEIQHTPLRLTPETQLDTALLLWLHLVDPAAATALTSTDAAVLHRELLAEAATREANLPSLAEQSVHTIALRHAVAAAVGSLDIHPSDPAGFVVNLCRQFPHLLTELGRRHNKRPPFAVNDEYDVQDLLRGLFRVHFKDVRREEWNPSYGGVQSRSDLLLKMERIVIETKMTRPSLGQRELVEQLIVDKEQYRSHPDCGTLVCMVYDPEQRLTNPAAVEQDLSERSGNLRTLVVVSPQGL